MTYICCLYDRLCVEFGKASGKAIIQKFITDLGGMRISIPGMDYLYREERNRKIREKYNGNNINELAYIWGLSPTAVRNILRGDENAL